MTRITNWWKRFLDKLSKAAEEEFGSKPPECCHLDAKPKKSTSHNTRRKAS